jgi:hypothetical protein
LVFQKTLRPHSAQRALAQAYEDYGKLHKEMNRATQNKSGGKNA